ncbi:Vacuolar protein sorting-associated protein 33A [Teratosphaeria destructans]|uniref:Vacuolar protein sorting-associated protein 33A n=1 Tax=Teratosphaeria destructans TaxID=418781 RepID=A0A9W7SJ69_9PEZI|nr:Vacuolar protein sorting-associated protein 33A [Teratosphaeria destructans]
MAAHSAIKAIDNKEITDKARRDLLLLLEQVRGKKNLVIERALAGTIGLFVKFSELQQYGVDKVFFLENHNIDSSQRNIIFLVRGENAKKVRTVAAHLSPNFLRLLLTKAEQIRLVRSESKIDHDFNIIWVPRRTLVSNLILEEHGVLGEANITELQLHFIPLEQDLLSLELDDAFGELTLRKDPTTIFASAQALMKLQKQYGLFPRILGKGDNAKKLADLLVRMRNEDEVNATSDPSNTYLTSFGLTPSSLVENLFIIDREVDFPTTLATQLTYEGLLDEVFTITNNQTEVENSILGPASGAQQQHSQGGTAPASTGGTKRKIQLDASDRCIMKFAIEQESIRSRDPKGTITELQDIAKRLPGIGAEQASLKMHTSIAEEITKYTRSDFFRRILEVEQNLLIGNDPSTMHENIDELIARGDTPLKTVLRLLCLESTLANGIRQRDLEAFKRQILQAYGYQHLLTLANLEKIGLLVSREAHRGFLNPIAGAAGQTATDWNAVRRSLQLWVDDVREADPEDIAYVFSGYAPLSVRLVQCVLQKSYLQGLANPPKNAPASGAPVGVTGSGWKGFEDSLARVRGATVDVVQKGSDADASNARKTLRGSKESPKTTIVFFLGGITFAEVAALRFISSQLEASSGRKIVIGTTGLLSGKRVVGAGIEGRSFGS